MSRGCPPAREGPGRGPGSSGGRSARLRTNHAVTKRHATVRARKTRSPSPPAWCAPLSGRSSRAAPIPTASVMVAPVAVRGQPQDQRQRGADEEVEVHDPAVGADAEVALGLADGPVVGRQELGHDERRRAELQVHGPHVAREGEGQRGQRDELEVRATERTSPANRSVRSRRADRPAEPRDIRLDTVPTPGAVGRGGRPSRAWHRRRHPRMGIPVQGIQDPADAQAAARRCHAPTSRGEGIRAGPARARGARQPAARRG